MPTVSRGATLGEQVYGYIRGRIVSGEYEPGQVLVESELAGELVISRTPVSHAIIMLKEHGLLEDRVGKAVVPRLSLTDVTQLYECRLALDGLATRLATERMDENDLDRLERDLDSWEEPASDASTKALWVSDLGFHETIYQACGNKHLMRIAEITIELVATHRQRTLRQLNSFGDGENGSLRTEDDVRREHRDILEAMRLRSPEKAERAARQHISNIIKHLSRSNVVDSGLL